MGSVRFLPICIIHASFGPGVIPEISILRDSNSMPEVLQGTLDSRVSPSGILSRHSGRQLLDNLHNPTSPWGAALVGPLLGNKLPVPTEDGVGSDERGNFREGPSADGLSSYGQSASLIICQAKSSATELLLQGSVLLAEILDDCVLLAGDPACHGGDEDLPGLKDDGHPGIVAWRESSRQLSSTVWIGLFLPGFCSAE